MSTLTVFDLDDTLFTSPGKVYVRRFRTHELVREVDYSMGDTLGDGEYYDYSQFRSAQYFFDTAKPIVKMVKRFKKIVAERDNDSRVCIVTARADLDNRDMFLAALDRYGVYHKDVHIYRAGNYSSEAPSTELRKCHIIENIINGPMRHDLEKVVMFDDSYANLKAFVALKEKYDHVEFEAYHVNHKAKVTRYHP